MDKTKLLRKHIENDELKKCRSLICDENGIIIGEMVYRCLICSHISDGVSSARDHYRNKHVDVDDCINGGGEHDSSEMSSGALNESRSASPSASLVDNCELDNDKSFAQESETGTSVTITTGPKDKSGYLNCTICGMTRFYSSVQKRYGQNACAACYRYFREFLLKPKIYKCPTLSQCPLNIRNRCKACWLKACIDTYDGKFDAERQQVMDSNRPVREILDEDMDSDDGSDGNSQFEREKDVNENDNALSSVKSIIYKNGRNKRCISCMKCDNCVAEECGQCVYCLDRPKYGGEYKLRELCVKKRCIQRVNRFHENDEKE